MATKLQIWNRAASAAGETQPINSEQDPYQAAVLLAASFDDKLRELLELRPWQFAKMQATLTEVTSLTASFTGDGGTTQYVVPYDNSDPSQLTVNVAGADLDLGTGWTYTLPTNGYDGVVTLAVAPGPGVAVKITVATTRTGWEHVYALPANFVSPIALLEEGERQDALIDPRERIAFEILPSNSGNGFVLCTDQEPDDFESFAYIGVPSQMNVLPGKFVEALVCLLGSMLARAIPKDMDLSRALMQDYRVALNDAVMVDNANAGQPEYRESKALACR